MSWYGNYIENISMPNKEFYEENAQAWIDDYFYDSTLVRMIQEEQFPFNEVYDEYLVHVDSVAENTVNINKVMGDYINVIFKDCGHKNYRGQKYKLDTETYLCYDKIDSLTKIAETKLLRCNNELNWIDKENGNLLKEPIFLGYEISSTNDQYSKKGNLSNRRMTIYCQYNDKTKKITTNQRFMFNGEQCFRVEELDNYNFEIGLKEVTLMKMILAFSPFYKDRDNSELNICDYYNNQYDITITERDIEQVQGYEGKLTAVVKYNGTESDNEVIWKSENDKVVSIDENGHYVINGTVGEKCEIRAYIKDNDSVYDYIYITVVEDYMEDKQIIVYPMITELKQGLSQDFTCGVYINNELQTDEIECIASGCPEYCYDLEEIQDGYRLTNNRLSSDKLVLTFSSEDCEDVVIQIRLKGVM